MRTPVHLKQNKMAECVHMTRMSYFSSNASKHESSTRGYVWIQTLHSFMVPDLMYEFHIICLKGTYCVENECDTDGRADMDAI